MDRLCEESKVFMCRDIVPHPGPFRSAQIVPKGNWIAATLCVNVREVQRRVPAKLFKPMLCEIVLRVLVSVVTCTGQSAILVGDTHRRIHHVIHTPERCAICVWHEAKPSAKDVMWILPEYVFQELDLFCRDHISVICRRCCRHRDSNALEAFQPLVINILPFDRWELEELFLLDGGVICFEY